MESIKMLKPRERIQVIDKIDNEKIELSSTIIGTDFENDKFLIYNPIYKNRIYTLSKEKIYEFRYIDEKTGIYSFDGMILSRIKEKKMYILKIKFKGNFKKIQRREFFRIDVIKNVVIKEPQAEKYKESLKMIDLIDKIQFDEKKYLIKDLSGGGFGFYSKDKFFIGKIIVAKFNVGINDLEVMGKVVRVIDIDDNKYLIGVQYLHLTTQKRSLIINFIYERQRQMRQKGLV